MILAWPFRNRSSGRSNRLRIACFRGSLVPTPTGKFTDEKSWVGSGWVPVCKVVGATGIEPMTSTVSS